MSDVKRYYVYEDHLFSVEAHGPAHLPHSAREVRLASDYGALAAKYADLEASFKQGQLDHDAIAAELDEAKRFTQEAGMMASELYIGACKERDALLAALERYGKHDYDCPNEYHSATFCPTNCRCGLAEALRGTERTADQPTAAPAKEAISTVADRLMKFYGVATLNDLVMAQDRHIERLQAKVPPIKDETPGRVREG